MKNTFSINAFLPRGNPEGTVAFIVAKQPELFGRKGTFAPWFSPRSPICTYEINIFICTAVALHINTQFTNVTACFHSQNTGFFKIFFPTHSMV